MNLLSAIVLIPFFSALLLGIVYLYDPEKERENFYAGIGIFAPALSALLALTVGWEMLDMPSDTVLHSSLFDWIALGDFHISLAFMADRLSAVMIAFITFIGTLIHIYAAGYMKGDPAFGKFFAYFNLFMGSMLLLVLADNPMRR